MGCADKTAWIHPAEAWTPQTFPTIRLDNSAGASRFQPNSHERLRANATPRWRRSRQCIRPDRNSLAHVTGRPGYRFRLVVSAPSNGANAPHLTDPRSVVAGERALHAG